ncbi:hypothetical protein SELMODRAFT_413001 [Selaginella moellendorffii]|uniref:Uncharacterized protein n=1 Tax=Selaginella moellendorffii TaxID=88036 RepID=D8RN11_SELML|nr:hypothetical protein SELMODRAFT_413001 [Selaginella moellendorffii]
MGSIQALCREFEQGAVLLLCGGCEQSRYQAPDDLAEWRYEIFSPRTNLPGLSPSPGCSSVGIGAFTELGPFHPGPKSDGLVRNEHQVSNMLFVDAPVGVGWAYSHKVEKHDDEKTCMFSYISNLFVIFYTSERSGCVLANLVCKISGHYVPQLAAHLLDHNKQKASTFNLKGIAIGNPILDILLNSKATLASSLTKLIKFLGRATNG